LWKRYFLLKPVGFFYYPHLISNDEEKILHDEILKISLLPLLFPGYEAKRKVASFGHDWNFQTGTLSKGREIPHTFQFIIEKIAKKISIPDERLGELLITEYPVGSVINWHRDAPPFDVIAGISLLITYIFRFRPYEKSKQNRKAIISVALQPRSLYIISGKARTDWEHSIPTLKQIRYSITVRTLK